MPRRGFIKPTELLVQLEDAASGKWEPLMNGTVATEQVFECMNDYTLTGKRRIGERNPRKLFICECNNFTISRIIANEHNRHIEDKH